MANSRYIEPVKKFCLQNWRLVALLILAGYLMTMLWINPWSRPLGVWLRVGSFTSALWVTLWLGNSSIGSYMGRVGAWMKAPTKTFLIAMTATVVFTVADVAFLAWFFEVAFGFRFRGDFSQFVWSSLGVTIVISSFMHGRAFLNGWRDATLNAERLQKETIKAQYENLKTQVNPHFLFNSMNALTNLIYEDQDKAVKFVKQLSDVYRYVLDTQSKEIVPLSEELRFLKSYIFLQQIRFGDKLRIEPSLEGADAFVAPLVLQMLVENAIKHNVISNDQPLTIRLFFENDYIVVSNNLQLRNLLPDESKGIGLKNISNRYGFLTDKKVLVESTEKEFTVKLPFVNGQHV